MKSIKMNPRYMSIFTEMTGVELMYLLKRLGISQRSYGLMMDPPMNSAAAVNNYRSNKKLPMRMIWPLLQKYDHGMLVSLLEQNPRRK